MESRPKLYIHPYCFTETTIAWFPHCRSPLAASSSSSSAWTEASLQFLTHIGLLVFTHKQDTMRMFHISRPRILQDSFITASSALCFAFSLAHRSWSLLLPKFALQEEPLVWQLSVHHQAGFKGCHLLLTYLSAAHHNSLPGSADSRSDKLSFCTCHVHPSFGLLSNTYPPPQLIWPSRCEPALLSQWWKQSGNSTSHISNGFFFHVNKPFSTYLILENINIKILIPLKY